MEEVTKDQFTGMVEERRENLIETIRRKAEQEADTKRQEVGEIVIDATDDYFPEAVKRRRRRDVASGFVLGVLVGFAVRYVVGR